MSAVEAMAAEVEAHLRPCPDNKPKPGEIAVLRLTAQGLSTKQIARQLGITPEAAIQRRYRASLRMGTRNATHTVVECIRRGWIEAER